MKKIKIDDTSIINDEIIFPVEFNSIGVIVDKDEILFSSRHKIDKNSCDILLEKEYDDSIKSLIDRELDNFRDINLKCRRFKLNRVYIMQNISVFDGGYRYDAVYFVKEDDGVYAYCFHILDDFERVRMSYTLDREELERLFSLDDGSAFYVFNSDLGLIAGENSKDGKLESKFHILTDEEIENKYNNNMKIYKRLYDLEYTPKTIDEIKNFNVTGELFNKNYALVKVFGERIVFLEFSIKMIERGKFELDVLYHKLFYFKNDILTTSDDIKEKLLYTKSS